MSWVGGDIPALQSAGTTLKSAPDKMKSVVHDLSSSVDKLVESASWSGDAAESMRGKWSRNAIEAADVGTFIGSVGDSLSQLGDGLSHIDGALYDAADACKQRGAQIDMSNGKPLPLVIQGDQNTPAAQGAIRAQNEYKDAYAYAMQSAKALRMAAATEIESLVKPVITPAGAEGAEADKPTMASILRGIYTGRFEATGIRIENLKEARESATKGFNSAADQLQGDLESFAKTGGPTLPASLLQHASDFDGALSKFQVVDKEVSAKIPELEGRAQLPGSAFLNTKVADLAKRLPTGDLATKLRLFNEIPVVDVGLSAVMVGFQVHDDVQKGADMTTAIKQDGAAAAGGLVAGVLVAGAIPGPGWAAAAGIGAAALVGDGLYQGFHEHWSEDIHDHGVIKGIGQGISNSASREWDDMKAMGNAVGDASKEAWHATEDKAKSVWHSLFG